MSPARKLQQVEIPVEYRPLTTEQRARLLPLLSKTLERDAR